MALLLAAMMCGLLSAGGLVATTAAVAKGNPCAHAPAYGWLHTDGNWILDEHGCKVRLVSVDWYGMETTNYVPAGLNFRPYTAILAKIKSLGFNSIRFSISEQMIRDNSKLYPRLKYIKANPELARLHPLGILDRIIAAAHSLGLMIILDHHGTIAAPPKTADIEPTWNGYTEDGWIADWMILAKRYADNPTVIGFDLLNEPHTAGPGPWTLQRYLTQGATWGPYPSRLWNPINNWPAAATKCGDAILSVNPHALIFVEGVQIYPDSTQPGGVETYWWGGTLRGVAVDPVILSIPHQLVYSPHEWGPRRTDLDFFSWRTSYKSLASVYYSNWAYILHSKNPRIQAPIWLGEFNTCNFTPSCIQDTGAGTQGQWFQIFVRFLKANPEVGWAYYPINGTNAVDKRSNNSILNQTWTGVRLPGLMRDLKPIISQPSS